MENTVYDIPKNISQILYRYLQMQDPNTLARIKDRSVTELGSRDPNISQNAKDVLVCIDLIEKRML